MAVAVTGATGFLGRHIVQALGTAGAELRLLVRRQPDFPLPQRATIISGGLEDEAACAALLDGAHAVIHAAGLIKACRAGDFRQVNEAGTARLAGLARRLAPEARFLLVSSLAARAPGLSPYAASKRAGEAAAQAAYAAAPDRLVILRPAAIYGPGDRESLAIFKAARHGIALDYGPGRVAFIHAQDAAAAIVAAMERAASGIYALSGPDPAGCRAHELVAEAARALGVKPPRRIRIPGAALLAAGHASGLFAAARRRPALFTAGKAREMLHLDWSVHPDEALPDAVHRPGIGLAAGFAATAAWYKAAGWIR